MNFGAITPNDAALLEALVMRFKGRILRFLEIGTHEGNTARGVKELCDRDGISIDLRYYGIDARDLPPPFDGAWQISGRSEEAWEFIPGNMDIVFVDGCHCINHVILDVVHYSAKVVVGGYMVFHDTDPQVQGVQTNPWVHKGDGPIYRTAVLAALEKLGWPNERWQLDLTASDPQSDIGGMMAFRRGA